MGVRGELYSNKVILPNRTYFFNVKENRTGDLYLNIVESKNRETGGFERQSVIMFADDLQEFLKGFDESLKVLEKAMRDKKHSGGSSPKHFEKSPRFEKGERSEKDPRMERSERPERGSRMERSPRPRPERSPYGGKREGSREEKDRKFERSDRGGERHGAREYGGGRVGDRGGNRGKNYGANSANRASNRGGERRSERGGERGAGRGGKRVVVKKRD